MKKRKFWNSDKIVAVVAMGISLVTLLIFVRQTNIIEEQSRLSVLPYLMIETSYNGYENTFVIDVVNYGVGPAIIEGKTFVHKGKEYNMELVDFLKTMYPAMDSVTVTNSSSLQSGLAIPAGNTRHILRVGGGQKSYDAFMGVIEQMNADSLYYEIRYRSIYEDRWKISSLSESPKRLD